MSLNISTVIRREKRKENLFFIYKCKIKALIEWTQTVTTRTNRNHQFVDLKFLHNPPRVERRIPNCNRLSKLANCQAARNNANKCWCPIGMNAYLNRDLKKLISKIRRFKSKISLIIFVGLPLHNLSVRQFSNTFRISEMDIKIKQNLTI